jgi:hypothetical protein
MASQLWVVVVYLDPVFYTPPRLHAQRHKGWVDEIIVQQLKTPMARGSSFRHGCQGKWHIIFYHHLADDNLSTQLGVRVNPHLCTRLRHSIVPGPGAVTVITSATGSVAIVPTTAVSMATASGIIAPLASAPIKINQASQ